MAVRDLQDPEAAPYRARDLGLGGLFLLTERRWPVGMTRSLRVEHGSTSLSLSGRVVRVTRDGVAFAFIGLDEEERSAIRRLLVDLVYGGARLDEQRAAPRFATTSPVLWSWGSVQVRTTLADLSPTGATLKAAEPPPVDTEIYVQLPLLELRAGVPVVEEVQGSKARVVRHLRDGFAVRFHRPSEAFRRAIHAWEGGRAAKKG